MEVPSCWALRLRALESRCSAGERVGRVGVTGVLESVLTRMEWRGLGGADAEALLEASRERGLGEASWEGGMPSGGDGRLAGDAAKEP